jgi:AbrB family looped-hinge helix DNA binding protein
MSLIQLRDKAQITIPSNIRKELGIKKGDYFEIIKDNNRIVLIPKVLVDKTSIMLSEKGEKYLGEALGDVKEGKISVHENANDMISELKKK